jgi:hypothetical protein
MIKTFIGNWGDKFSIDGLNIKIEKKDGKIFFISPQDIRKFLRLQDLLTEKHKIESEIESLN